MSTMWPQLPEPRELPARGEGSGREGCGLCGGVGHVRTNPEAAGWVNLGDGRWQIPRNGEHVPAIHNPRNPVTLFRGCVCRNA